MKLLIVHLSDIHTSATTTYLVERATKIIDAIKYLESEITQVFFVITGDIAFSGKMEEYFIASEFLDTLKKLAELRISKNVKFIIVPGNHDCYFSEDEEARNQIIDSQKNNRFQITGKSVPSLCTKNQDNFFNYCFELYSDNPKLIKDNLFYQYSYGINGFIISFNCINSAWMSILKDTTQYGQMGFPSSYLEKNISSDFVVSLFHHPLNWFEGTNAKLTKKISSREF